MCEDCTDTYISNWEEGDYIMHDNFSYDDYQVNIVQNTLTYGIRDTFYNPLNVDIKDVDKITDMQVTEGPIVQNNEKVVTHGMNALGSNCITKPEQLDTIGKYEMFKQQLDPEDIKDKVGIYFRDVVELFSKFYDATEPLREQGNIYQLKSNLYQYTVEACNNIETISNGTLLTGQIAQCIQDQLCTNTLLEKQTLKQQLNSELVNGFCASNCYQNGYAIKFEYYKIMCISNYDYNML